MNPTTHGIHFVSTNHRRGTIVCHFLNYAED
jgi:hypothetical protein